MKNNTHTTHSSALKRQLERIPSFWVCIAILLVLFLSGCAAPMNPRKDAEFQSYAYATNRPVVRPTRSLSSFSESLLCMDRILRE